MPDTDGISNGGATETDRIGEDRTEYVRGEGLLLRDAVKEAPRIFRLTVLMPYHSAVQNGFRNNEYR